MGVDERTVTTCRSSEPAVYYQNKEKKTMKAGHVTLRRRHPSLIWTTSQGGASLVSCPLWDKSFDFRDRILLIVLNGAFLLTDGTLVFMTYDLAQKVTKTDVQETAAGRFITRRTCSPITLNTRFMVIRVLHVAILHTKMKKYKSRFRTRRKDVWSVNKVERCDSVEHDWHPGVNILCTYMYSRV